MSTHTLIEPEQQKPEPAEDLPSSKENPVQSPDQPLDPTRYGDWEKNGRCIDF